MELVSVVGRLDDGLQVFEPAKASFVSPLSKHYCKNNFPLSEIVNDVIAGTLVLASTLAAIANRWVCDTDVQHETKR